jgi:hypothetical protein
MKTQTLMINVIMILFLTFFTSTLNKKLKTALSKQPIEEGTIYSTGQTTEEVQQSQEIVIAPPEEYTFDQCYGPKLDNTITDFQFIFNQGEASIFFQAKGDNLTFSLSRALGSGPSVFKIIISGPYNESAVYLDDTLLCKNPQPLELDTYYQYRIVINTTFMSIMVESNNLTWACSDDSGNLSKFTTLTAERPQDAVI